MKSWLFGKEIPYFKPLRHELGDAILEKIELSENLLKEGWTKDDVIELIKRKGFLDPNYENFIRTADHLINVQHFTVISINSIHKPIVQVNERIPVFFKDFIKNQKLNVTHDFEDRGVFYLWVVEDLNAEGKFKNKEKEIYFFETRHFIYSIDKEYNLINIYNREPFEEISHIEWGDNGFKLKTIDGLFYSYFDDYADWLSFIVNYSDFTWCVDDRLPSKVDNLIEDLNMKWVIHPNVWKDLKVNNNKDKEIYISLFKKDWLNNAYITVFKDKSCEMIGWRFYYIWDGFILKEVLTPNKSPIESIRFEDDFLILNDTIQTSLIKDSPEKITDLVEGNFVKILPLSNVRKLQLHPHAIQRYEQRIDHKTYLCTMLSDILYQVYNYGQVVRGAHTDERRKIETNRFGYVLSDELVISVWDKHKHKVKRRKNRKSSRLRNLDKITRIFSKIENGKI